MGKKWDISPEGVAEIRTLSKNVAGCMERLDQAWKEMAGAATEYGEDLGIYADSLNSAIDTMAQLNEVSREAMEMMTGRLEQYADKIEELLSDTDLE